MQIRQDYMTKNW